jgi:hypothetical protein
MVIPKWSLDNLSQNSNIGHIIFQIINNTGKKIIVHGYRMLRISPDGKKDYYYKGKRYEESELNIWWTAPHVKVILWEGDEHIFNWNEVNIIETYGINKKGKWGTEVKIAYIEEGSNGLSVSTGTTTIEFE